MDKILPVIEMDTAKQAEEPPPQENNLPEIPGDKELINKIQEDLLDNLPESDDEIIQVDERIIPDEDDVFGEPPPPRVKPITAAEEQIAPAPPAEFEQKTGKRKYTRKAPMSEKQKLHLDKIRKISLEKRAQKKIEKELEKKRKEEEKEEQRINKAAEKLLAKQKKEEAAAAAPTPREQSPPQQSRQQVVGQTFTRQDMEEAMFSAISSYETIRKKNKEEKKKEELAAARQNQMRRTLEQAIKPQAAPDPWRQYF